MKVLSVDVETKSQNPDAPENALHFKRNQITVIGVVTNEDEDLCFRDIKKFKSWLNTQPPDSIIVGHNFIGFDYKTLVEKGVNELEGWLVEGRIHDTQLLAVAYTRKVPGSYLERYEEKRKELNKMLPRGVSHRQARGYSLKVLHPYFCMGSWFWETPGNHDNDQYVLEDCRRTLELYDYLVEKTKEEGTYEFYKVRLLNWATTITEAEREGIRFDISRVSEKEEEAKERAKVAYKELECIYGDELLEYRKNQRLEVENKYREKAAIAEAKLKSKTKDKIAKLHLRYEKNKEKALSKLAGFNFDSPTQLSWLLKSRGYNLVNLEGKESTGVEVLEKLIDEGHSEIGTLLEYRKQKKLSTAFFPSYHKYLEAGRIHCSFKMHGTRTGRLSSSNPNLQQQPPVVRDLFIAGERNMLVTRDFSGIEPVIIAFYTEDPTLCELLLRGGNFHSANTPTFFPYVDCTEQEVKTKYPLERKVAKELGLLLMYGGGWRRVKMSMLKYGFAIPDERCREIYNNYRERYAVVFDFKQELLDKRLASGQAVTNLLGRSFRLDPDDVYMKGLNTLAQSTGSDLGLHSAYKIKERAPWIRPRLWVHDELVLEVPEGRLKEAERIIEEEMTGYELKTKYGDLTLQVEGDSKRYWAK